MATPEIFTKRLSDKEYAERARLAICIFTFNRPQYLSELMLSLESQVDLGSVDLHVFQDGAVNVFSGRQASDPEFVAASIHMAVHRHPFSRMTLHARKKNVGVAIQQYEAYNTIARNYRWAVWLDDDVVLGPHFIRTCRLLLPFLHRDVNAFSASPGFTRMCPREKVDECLSKVKLAHFPWVGYLADMTKWPRLRKVFDEYFEIVRGVDYRFRPHGVIRQWFRSKGWPNQASSQDGGKDCAMYVTGLHKYRCMVNRGFYIGVEGEHGNPSHYEREGWVEHKPFVHPADEDLSELVLVK